MWLLFTFESKANIRHLFNHHTELNITLIHFRTSKETFDIYFSIFRSWMLLLFTFEHKSKHQKFILSSYRVEYHYYSFLNVKANIRQLFHHLPEPNVILIHFRRQNQLSDINLSTVRSWLLSLLISQSISKHPTFILVSYGVECYRYSFPKLRVNIWHLF